MPINIKPNIIVITGTISASTPIQGKLTSIYKIVWSGATTAAHKATLTDWSGFEIIDFVADAPGTDGQLMYAVDFTQKEGLVVNGLKCTDLDSGKLFIYTNPI